MGAHDILRRAAGRHILRIGFGLFWLLDGLLQVQSAMPLGMPPSVLRPSASWSPAWVQHLMNVGVTIWANHPVQAAAATVWIQVGIGCAARGTRAVGPGGPGCGRLGWGLVVWIFGEAFGAIFAPGSPWLFGAPAAVVFYGVGRRPAGLARPVVAGPRLGRLELRAMGLFSWAWPSSRPGRGAASGRVGSAMTPARCRHGRPHGADAAAGIPGELGGRLRLLRRGPRVGGEPVPGDRPGRHRGGPLHRPAAVVRRRPAPRSSCAWPTGSWWRTSASSAGWAPTRTR